MYYGKFLPPAVLHAAGFVLLTVCQCAGAEHSPPVLSVHFAGNQAFLWPGSELHYQVIVSDQEDGDTLAGSIPETDVQVIFGHLPAGDDTAVFEVAAIEYVDLSRGKALIKRNDCVLCHSESAVSIVPAYKNIALRYRGEPDALGRLASRIIDGGQGAWGTMPMTPHPDLAQDDAEAMVAYILSLAGDTAPAPVRLPLRGTLALPRAAEGTPGERHFPGRYRFQVSYKDRGEQGKDRKSLQFSRSFRSPFSKVDDFDRHQGMRPVKSASGANALSPAEQTAYIAFEQIDLGGVVSLGVHFEGRGGAGRIAGIEARLDRPDGRLLGSTAASAEPGASGPDCLYVPLEKTGDLHDVYIIFTGRPATASGDLLVTAIDFQRQGEVAC